MKNKIGLLITLFLLNTSVNAASYVYTYQGYQTSQASTEGPTPANTLPGGTSGGPNGFCEDNTTNKCGLNGCTHDQINILNSSRCTKLTNGAGYYMSYPLQSSNGVWWTGCIYTGLNGYYYHGNFCIYNKTKIPTPPKAHPIGCFFPGQCR
jgi:hypothetical protein